jgi:dipeptidase E
LPPDAGARRARHASAVEQGCSPGARRAGRVPTIFAMGGGGFTMEPDNPALDEYVLTLTPAREPRICLLPTAGGDSADQIRRFEAAFRDQLCEPSHVSLFRLGTQPVPLHEHLLAQDVIYVGGGSMVNLLALWLAHGVDAILREAWQAGIVLAGLSAGSMCWFEWGVTKSGGRPAPTRGLGFLPGSNSVHYDGEPERRPAYLAAVGRGDVPAGWGVDDGAGLLFRGKRLAEVVASRPGARAFRVHSVEGEVVEEPIEPRLLKARPHADPLAPLAVEEMRALAAARRGWRRD